MAKYCRSSDDDEENVVEIEIDKSMTEEDVIELILKRADTFYNNKG